MPESTPLLSVVTPTFNRREFLPYLRRFFEWQQYEHNELVVLDDSPQPNADLFKGDDRIRYFHSNQRINIGKKRNELNRLARGEVIVCFDDDDYCGR
jgi:glycosyltransferase involved in cell wall biosynthesis